MDAHFFRALTVELEENLRGRRVEKIFSPADGVWTFALQSKGGKEFLLFRPAKSVGLLFLSRVKPLNPPSPTSQVMWLRKRLGGRRLFETHHDWINLRVAFTLSPFIQPEKYRYLLLDMKNGVSLIHDLPEGFAATVSWPAYDEIKQDSDVWRSYPQISPPLRKTLAALPREQGLQLLYDLKGGIADSFYLSKDKTGEFLPPRVWASNTKQESIFTSAVEASAAYGEKILFPVMERLENAEQRSTLKSGKKKFKKVLKRIEEEEERLRALQARKIEAEALQAEMYRIKDLREVDCVTVNHPEHGEMDVKLDPALTPTENMQRIFKFAAKAQRGFKHMERRRKEVETEHDSFIQSNLMPTADQSPEKGNIQIPSKYKNIAAALFVSSDGFLMIRGKNSKANHEILSKVSSVFDYWFHVQGGPGSHVILKRDHPGQEVPEKTFHEAAALAALKSYRANDSKADVMCALVKDVRKVKGYALGQVAVDNVLRNLHVNVDPLLEAELVRK
ncbi:NFACT RNA binding domain-containing protein [Maridesulfovibrio zosterae]|uniref:NFACT RNA binding domain-containing protein n=1 Tax=Maridesulfovibrio zosterae TaxID=82171 RepID=UPI000400D449|nr:NFACT RNA binding domain-containing protein [Maridesulfovibrio zosterae]